MDSLCRILFGECSGFGEASDTLRYIRKSIKSFSEKAEALLDSAGSDDLTLIGPYCARVLMETGCAAIVGRVDPFRILYLSRFQSHTGYDPSKRSRSSFAWQGDVLTPDKEKEYAWNENTEPYRISRALFSQHYDLIHWRPAVNAALDAAASVAPSPAITEFLSTDSEKFVSELKGR